MLHFTGTKCKALTNVHVAFQKANHEPDYVFATQEYKYSATVVTKPGLSYLPCMSGFCVTIFFFKPQM